MFKLQTPELSMKSRDFPNFYCMYAVAEHKLTASICQCSPSVPLVSCGSGHRDLAVHLPRPARKPWKHDFVLKKL
jgi:hypothetical protein